MVLKTSITAKLNMAIMPSLHLWSTGISCSLRLLLLHWFLCCHDNVRATCHISFIWKAWWLWCIDYRIIFGVIMVLAWSWKWYIQNLLASLMICAFGPEICNTRVLVQGTLHYTSHHFLYLGLFHLNIFYFNCCDIGYILIALDLIIIRVLYYSTSCNCDFEPLDPLLSPVSHLWHLARPLANSISPIPPEFGITVANFHIHKSYLTVVSHVTFQPMPDITVHGYIGWLYFHLAVDDLSKLSVSHLG